jgi:hypothetical protein
MDKSMRGWDTASAPSWRPRAMRAFCCASDRWKRANAPAAIAASRRTPTPTSRPLRRRFRPPLARQLALALGPALGEELALELVQLLPAACGPVEGGGQARAPVELRSVPVGSRPTLRALGQVFAELPALGVLR